MTEKVTELLKKKNLDAILISDGYNMRYLSGFGGATGYLYISADQKVLMTDSRYTTQAKQEAPKFAVVEVSTEKGYRELITECIRKDQTKTIGFEDQQMTCADFKKISSPTKDEATWMELGEEVNLLRCIIRNWHLFQNDSLQKKSLKKSQKQRRSEIRHFRKS